MAVGVAVEREPQVQLALLVLLVLLGLVELVELVESLALMEQLVHLVLRE
jgi:hypothetical protein